MKRFWSPEDWAKPLQKSSLDVQCCIAGGGPAGMMLGFLLARAGVRVCVLEKHKDFLRDFRGDTIHPSTMEIMHELGILDKFLRRPHQELSHLNAQIGEITLTLADFSHLPTHCQFVALMPQWDFLNFILEEARQYPTFQLLTQAEVTGLIEENGRVIGVQAKTLEGPIEIRAALTVGADGRHSVVRECAGLEVITLGAPMDVLWLRLSHKSTDPKQTFGHVDAGRFLALLDRETYWQIAYVIPKGTAEEIKQKGLEFFRQDIARLEPFLSDRVEELHSWDDVKLLTVAVDRLRCWSKPGLLCIGDAAHAMSPIGGVGINLAIQDAVAAANLLHAKLKTDTLTDSDLRAVQCRRMYPTWATQKLQIYIQNNLVRRVLGSTEAISFPWILKLIRRWPILQQIPARLVGLGFRPEHIAV